MKEQIHIGLNKIKPNPYKKHINEGKLNEVQVEKLVEGFKQTEFHENLLARRNKKGEIELVYGHHRLEAAKRVYGKDHEISLNIVDFTDEQMLVDMCRENLTQRWNEFRDEFDSVILAKDYLEKHKPTVHQVDSRKEDGTFQKGISGNPDAGIGARQVAAFLSKDGKALNKSKVAELLQMHDNLDEEILKKVKKVGGCKAPEDVVTYKEATALARIKDKKEQAKLLEIVENDKKLEGRPHEYLIDYRNAPEEIKEEVLEGKTSLADIKVVVKDKKFQDKLEAQRKKLADAKKAGEIKIVVQVAEELVADLREEFVETTKHIEDSLHRINQVNGTSKGYGWWDKRSKKDLVRLVDGTLNKARRFVEELEKISQEVKI